MGSQYLLSHPVRRAAALGAFTGAVSTKRGLFQEADGGTLFLDEIGDMSFGLQSKLLRVVQDGHVRPVGGNQSNPVDVRVIAATNRDLKAAIEDGHFRRDLYYRLSVIPISIPPLRERPDDIPLLAEAFLRKHGDGDNYSISPQAMDRLRHYGWDGNARELENVIERAIAFTEAGELGPEDIPLPMGQDAQLSGNSLEGLLDHAEASQMTLDELCSRYTSRVLEGTGGNKALAAKILGINRRTLYRRGFGANMGKTQNGHQICDRTGLDA
jgi:two-component system response regulator AtoC